jgi:hypothetical protein
MFKSLWMLHCVRLQTVTFQRTTVPSDSGSSRPVTLALLDPKDEGTMLHQKMDNYLPADGAQHLRRLESSWTLLSEPQYEQYV